MGWFNILKFHVELKRLLEGALEKKEEMYIGFLTNDESELRDMWNSSNPNEPYIARSQKGIKSFYPIDEWYGIIVKEESKARLVAISGFAIRNGIGGKEYAVMGGTRRSKGNKYRGYGKISKSKPTELTKQYPRIVGYDNQGKIYSGQFNEKPLKAHAVIPEDILGKFKGRYGDNWGVGESINTLRYWNEDWD